MEVNWNRYLSSDFTSVQKEHQLKDIASILASIEIFTLSWSSWIWPGLQKRKYNMQVQYTSIVWGVGPTLISLQH